MSAQKIEPIELTEEWDKVFQLSDEVNHRKVTLLTISVLLWLRIFMNRWSIRASFRLLRSVALWRGEGAEFRTLCTGTGKRGFLAIAFDPSLQEKVPATREILTLRILISKITRRLLIFFPYRKMSILKKLELSVSAAGEVWRVQTVALDTRIKATAAMTMYDMSRNTALGYFDSVDEEGRYEARIAYNRQRTEDYKNGSYTMGGGFRRSAGRGTSICERLCCILQDRARLSSPFRQCK